MTVFSESESECGDKLNEWLMQILLLFYFFTYYSITILNPFEVKIIVQKMYCSSLY